MSVSSAPKEMQERAKKSLKKVTVHSCQNCIQHGAGYYSGGDWWCMILNARGGPQKVCSEWTSEGAKKKRYEILSSSHDAPR